MYSNTDFEKQKAQRKQMLTQMLLFALPGFVIAAVGLIMRIELVCTAGLLIACAVLIFFYDLKLKPVLRYGAYLKEIHSGLSRKTAGTLVRIGMDPVYMDGVWFTEIILNVYEDMSEEGERRFLLDYTKTAPTDLLDSDVALTSHGNFVLDIERMGDKHAVQA